MCPSASSYLASLVRVLSIRGGAARVNDAVTVQKKARKSEELFLSLEKIGRLERLIATAALVFGFLQDRDRKAVPDVARQLGETWKRPLRLDVQGIRALQAEFSRALQSQPEAELWMELAEGVVSPACAEAENWILSRCAGVVRE